MYSKLFLDVSDLKRGCGNLKLHNTRTPKKGQIGQK